MVASSGQTPGKDRRRSLAGRSRSEVARTGALVLLTVLITLFAVLNLDDVRVDWIFGHSRAPLIIVIVISLLVGIALSHFAGRLTRKRR